MDSWADQTEKSTGQTSEQRHDDESIEGCFPPPNGKSVTSAPSSAASWENPVVASGDLAGEIARLKRQKGKYVLAHGGASFAQSLVKLGLIDEYRLLVHAVALGRGLPLFSKTSKPINLRLLSSTSFASGNVANV